MKNKFGNKRKLDFDKIVEIEEYNVKNLDVYDLTIKDNHSYCANRIVVHNCITETKQAQANGYMLAHKMEEPDRKTYFVFDGSYSKFHGPNDSCNKFLGKICLFVEEPRDSDIVSKKDDPYASHYIWSGKTNIGRTKANEWIAIPVHPSCVHFWTKINPDTQVWDDELKKVIFKED